MINFILNMISLMLIISDAASSDCESNEFKCEFFNGTNSCLPESVICNGKIDCFGRTDDESIDLCKQRTCKPNEFNCGYGGCVPLNTVCNNIKDCFDGSDESFCDLFQENLNKTCNERDTVSCLIQKNCISLFDVCDGTADCGDNTDETYTACADKICPPYVFKCDYGACINSNLVCDGKSDCIDNSDETNIKCTNSNLTKTSKNDLCGSDRFQCGTNLCIDKTKVCDAVRDCDDGSDETIRLCENYRCDLNNFVRCRYGACVSNAISIQNPYCDSINKINRVTTTNTYPTTLRPTRPTFTTTNIPQPTPDFTAKPMPDYTTLPNNILDENKPILPSLITGCLFPQFPENGNYTSPTVKDYQLGFSIAEEWTILKFTCNDNYKLVGESIIVCSNKEWNHLPPYCAIKCPPLSSNNHDIECFYSQKPVPCDASYEGVIATVSCKDSYSISNFIYQPYNSIKCTKGSWNRELFKCEADCGTVVPRGQALVIKGQTVNKYEFPWHAGIYKKLSDNVYDQICGGTIISENVVISAAHCFWDWSLNRAETNASHYGVAVGKLYRQWKFNNDFNEQNSEVAILYLPSKFRAEQSNYANDIAILVLKQNIIFSPLVRPACLDWSNRLNKKILRPGNVGAVCGWGLTEEYGMRAEKLQSLKIPLVTYEECFNASPETFRPFITTDKICAGFKNGTSLCVGDSGGGLAIQKDTRYFLQGIVSVSPGQAGTCDPNSYVAFTSLINHLSWISEKELEFVNTNNTLNASVRVDTEIKTDDNDNDDRIIFPKS